MRDAPAVFAEDPGLATDLDAVKADAETLGVLLHGSRASGRVRDDSDYDLIRVVSYRGIAHEWGDDLEPLKALRFDGQD